MCASPFLGGDDEQIVEEEQVDGDKLEPGVEQSGSLGQFLQLSFLLQEASLGDDGDGLQTATETGTRSLHQTADHQHPSTSTRYDAAKITIKSASKILCTSRVPPLSTAGDDSGQEK